jgi:hypothetical protein
VAAAVLLASRLALHREVPRQAHVVSAPTPAVQVARVAPATPPAAGERPRSHRRRKPQPDLDRQFADYLRSLDESRHPATGSPLVTPIATSNPNVTIILLQESKGNSHE